MCRSYFLLLLLLISPSITESTQQKRARRVREEEFRSPTNAPSHHFIKAVKKKKSVQKLHPPWPVSVLFPTLFLICILCLHSFYSLMLLTIKRDFFHYFKASGEQLIPKNRKSVASATVIEKQVWKSTDPSRPKISSITQFLRLQLVHHWSAQTVQSICETDANFYT